MYTHIHAHTNTYTHMRTGTRIRTHTHTQTHACTIASDDVISWAGAVIPGWRLGSHSFCLMVGFDRQPLKVQ